MTVQKPMPVPTGISMFSGEKARISKRWADARFAKLVHFNESPKGGHLQLGNNLLHLLPSYVPHFTTCADGVLPFQTSPPKR